MVHRVHDVLLAAKIFFRVLDGGVSPQKLDLLTSGWLGNRNHGAGAYHGRRREDARAYIYLLTGCGAGMAFSSLPRKARGKSMALNSAPIRMTSEIRYIQTSSAIPAPSEP